MKSPSGSTMRFLSAYGARKKRLNQRKRVRVAKEAEAFDAELARQRLEVLSRR